MDAQRSVFMVSFDKKLIVSGGNAPVNMPEGIPRLKGLVVIEFSTDPVTLAFVQTMQKTVDSLPGQQFKPLEFLFVSSR
jgi:hypothetical protein